MISDTDVKTIINAALKKDFPLSSERLLLLVNSDLSTYELLDIVCDFINSLGTISKGKDAELLCKLKAKNKKLEEENKQLTANYNEAMISLLKEITCLGSTCSNVMLIVLKVHLREQDC